MNTITLSIAGMTCGHCIASVRKALATVPDVQVTNVTLGTAVLDVSDIEAPAVAAAVAAVTAAGYPASLGANAHIDAAASPGASCCTPSADMHTLSRARS